MIGSLTWLLLTVTVQVTIFAIVITGIQRGFLRDKPKASANLILLGMLLMLVVSATAILPVPSWLDYLESQSDASDAAVLVELDSTVPPAEPAIESNDRSTAPNSNANERPRIAASAAGWSDMLRTFAGQLQVDGSRLEVEQFSWFGKSVLSFGVCFMVLVIVGFVRLSIGFLSLRRLQRNSHAVTSEKACLLVEELCSRIGCDGRINLFQTNLVGTAATIGFRNPKIFLASDFDSWNPEEQASVLAHEIAHIHHRDFAANIVSQICTSLHFFNPMVHWLAQQMRLNQEVAADQIAAQITLGRIDYAKILASLALRQDNQENLRLASTFIPQENSFVRRIKVLQKAPRITVSRFSWAIPALTCIVAAAVCGLRAPASSNTVATSIEPVVFQEKAAEFFTDYISDRPDQVAVFLRPAALLKSNLAQELVNMVPFKKIGIESDKMFEQDTGIGTSEIEQLIQVTSFSKAEQLDRTFSVTRTIENNLENFKSLGETVGQDKSFPIQIERKALNAKHGLILDERTILWCFTERGIELAKETNNASVQQAAWYKKFKAVSKKPIVVVGGSDLIATSRDFSSFIDAGSIEKIMNAQTLVAAADVNHDVKFSVALRFLNQADAAAANEIVPKIKSSLEKILWGAAKSSYEPTKSMGKSAIDSINALESKVAFDTLELKSTYEMNLKVIKEAAGEIERNVARIEGMNNQRQLALALLNYESAYGHFPPAVIQHESGEVHSWRVAILPFLEQAELYAEYRFNEPWNSEHNRSVTKVMPKTYSHPMNESETNTNFFAVVGPETIFAAGKKMSFNDVADSTDNTIMLVEAVRDCHWAKPEDISFEEAARVATLGGLNEDMISVVLVNGATQQIPDDIPPLIFRSFLTIAGDEEFLLSEY